MPLFAETLDANGGIFENGDLAMNLLEAVSQPSQRGEEKQHAVVLCVRSARCERRYRHEYEL